jgi:N-acetylmuramoyl-L-alanine amidase CwlA
MKKKYSELNTEHINVFAGNESMAVALHVTTSTHTNSHKEIGIINCYSNYNAAEFINRIQIGFLQENQTPNINNILP